MKTHPNIADADGFYEAWLGAHEGLSESESADLDARLVLLLANQIGDQAVLLACIGEARATARTGQDAPGGRETIASTASS